MRHFVFFSSREKHFGFWGSKISEPFLKILGGLEIETFGEMQIRLNLCLPWRDSVAGVSNLELIRLLAVSSTYYQFVNTC